MLRFLLAALAALATLFVILFALLKLSGPGEMFLIRKLELLTPSESRALQREQTEREPGSDGR